MFLVRATHTNYLPLGLIEDAKRSHVWETQRHKPLQGDEAQDEHTATQAQLLNVIFTIRTEIQG